MLLSKCIAPQARSQLQNKLFIFTRLKCFYLTFFCHTYNENNRRKEDKTEFVGSSRISLFAEGTIVD